MPRRIAFIRCSLTLVLFSLMSGAFVSCSASAGQIDDAFLDEIQEAAFGYFWNECGTNGLIQDRMSDQDLSSTMAAGFQLPAICVGAERGWITREEAAERVLTILRTYESLPRFHGMWAHYYDISTGAVVPLMHKEDDGSDISETGFMVAGVLTCRTYFNKNDATESAIRKLATKLYEEVEWDWMLQDAEGTMHRTLAWHWSPKHGFLLGQRVESTMELSSMVTYLLAIGSPTHPIPAECWNEGWTKNYQWTEHNGHRFVSCPPLFAHQYPQVWFDLRNMKDKHVDYFRNAIYAVRANRDYCLTELYPDQDLWGLTYCDGPKGYGIYGYPPKRGPIDRDAVIPPTGAGGSIVFTPAESYSCLRYIYDKFHDKMWGKYGLYDAFSPKHNWFFEDYVAIDQGPIVLMIENLRSGLVWDTFMRNRNVQKALVQVGFTTVLDDFEEAPDLVPYNLWASSEHYSHRLTTSKVKDGQRALHITYDKKNAPQAVLTAHPAQKDFTRAKYLSLWTAGLDELQVSMEDSHNNKLALTPVGKVTSSDSWTHHCYLLPNGGQFDSRQVQSIHLNANPSLIDAKGTFLLDTMTLTTKADLAPPDTVQNVRTSTTRMPGDVLLEWDLSGDDEQAGTPYRYLAKYSTRPIKSEKDFQRALRLPREEDAIIHGSQNQLYVTGLKSGYSYHFSLKAEDLAGNVSAASKSISISLPSRKMPSDFMIDDFEQDDSPVVWASSSTNLSIAEVSETALRGSRSLKLTYHKSGERDQWMHAAAHLDIRSLSHHKFLSMWVSGQAEILVKVRNSADRQEELSRQTSELSSGWSPLYFDLSKLSNVDRGGIDQILIFIQPGKTEGSGSIFIDDMKLTRQRD